LLGKGIVDFNHTTRKGAGETSGKLIMGEEAEGSSFRDNDEALHTMRGGASSVKQSEGRTSTGRKQERRGAITGNVWEIDNKRICSKTTNESERKNPASEKEACCLS